MTADWGTVSESGENGRVTSAVSWLAGSAASLARTSAGREEGKGHAGGGGGVA